MKAVSILRFVAMWSVFALAGNIFALAGNIFGSLSENGQPAKGVEITVACGSQTYQARTGQDGSYSLRAQEPGRCTFSVNYKGETAETEVFSYEQPTRYDFELVMGEGGYELKKK